MLDASVQLIPLQPHHSRRHPIITPGIAKVRDELRDVIALRSAKVLVVLESERKPIEAAVALAVDVVFAQIRVVSSCVASVVDLGAFHS